MLAITSALGILAAMVLVIISSSTASAEVTVWTPGGECGSLQFTTVPDDVFSMSVVVRGGRGGRGGNQSSGEKGNPGDGGLATGTFAVTPGQTISARVGCPGIDGGDFDNTSSVPGWSNGGGSGRGWAFKPVIGGSGGSGGGSSAVCVGAACQPGAGTEVIVAGGGGGGGTSSCAGTAAGAGGAAGNQDTTANGGGAGPSGSTGLNGGNTGNNTNGGVGGIGGVNSTGATANGGTAPSEDGGFGATTVVGGGGGGGYVGGRQGGNSQPLCRGGGGGGGGSTWVKSTATEFTTNTHAGASGVTVTFAEPIVTTTSTSTSTTSSTSSTSSTTTTTTTPPTNLGSIRVESVPPVRTQIKLDGNIANSWGLDWVKVPQGFHGLCFSDVPGYTTPPCTAVNVAIGSTNVRTAEFIQRGYLNVTTSPAVASRISVDGLPRDNWGLFADFEPGSHEVCFGPVAGFTPPPCQTVNVTAGATTPVTGTFTPSSAVGLSGVGLLRVTTSPALPSQIVVDDVPMDRYGLDWLEIAPGFHTVCFTHVEGYTEPSCEDVNVTAGATTTVAGQFTQRGFLRVFTSPALPGTISINGLPANDWGVYTDVPVGQYQICYGFVPGRFIPPCQSASVTAGDTTTITGTYG